MAILTAEGAVVSDTMVLAHSSKTEADFDWDKAKIAFINLDF